MNTAQISETPSADVVDVPSSGTARSGPPWRSCSPSGAGESPCSSAGRTRTRCPVPSTSTTRPAASCSRAGSARRSAKISEPAEIYEFQNADRRPLVRFGRIGRGLSGWPQSSMFSQPDLEALLFARVAELPGVEVRRGVQVVGLDDDGATVTVHGERVAVEPDGNGGLRTRAAGDARPAARPLRRRLRRRQQHRPEPDRRADDRPRLLLRLADRRRHLRRAPHLRPARTSRSATRPARPPCVSGGPGRRRWEFMAPARRVGSTPSTTRPPPGGSSNPGAPRPTTRGSNVTPCTGSRPGGCTSGAAVGCCSPATPPTRRHRSPGKGLCSGLRDAANLAWKLDLVLAGTSPDALLDAYGPERAPNMEAVIELAIEHGPDGVRLRPRGGPRPRRDVPRRRRRQHHRHPAVPRRQRRHRPAGLTEGGRAVPPGRRRA